MQHLGISGISDAVARRRLLGAKVQLNTAAAGTRRQGARKTQRLKTDISGCVDKKILLGKLCLRPLGVGKGLKYGKCRRRW